MSVKLTNLFKSVKVVSSLAFSSLILVSCDGGGGGGGEDTSVVANVAPQLVADDVLFFGLDSGESASLIILSDDGAVNSSGELSFEKNGVDLNDGRATSFTSSFVDPIQTIDIDFLTIGSSPRLAALNRAFQDEENAFGIAFRNLSDDPSEAELQAVVDAALDSDLELSIHFDESNTFFVIDGAEIEYSVESGAGTLRTFGTGFVPNAFGQIIGAADSDRTEQINNFAVSID